jgi:hypothetical protein
MACPFRCHPNLAEGSILLAERSEWTVDPSTSVGMTGHGVLSDKDSPPWALQTPRFTHVVPIRIRHFDEPDLPGPRPVLQLTFTSNCLIDVGEFFNVYQSTDVVPGGVALKGSCFVLIDACFEVAGHADIGLARPAHLARMHPLTPATPYRRVMQSRYITVW